MKTDAKLDLVIERNLNLPLEKVWRAWTQPDLLKQWFCPKPWSVSDVSIDLRPGGEFITVMQSPEGQKFPQDGCYLEIVPNQKLVWTNAMNAGFRPKAGPQGLVITAALLLEAHGDGTKYTAIAIHPNAEMKAEHEKMGFHEGWNTTIDQLVELMKNK